MTLFSYIHRCKLTKNWLKALKGIFTVPLQGSSFLLLFCREIKLSAIDLDKYLVWRLDKWPDVQLGIETRKLIFHSVCHCVIQSPHIWNRNNKITTEALWVFRCEMLWEVARITFPSPMLRFMLSPVLHWSQWMRTYPPVSWPKETCHFPFWLSLGAMNSCQAGGYPCEPFKHPLGEGWQNPSCMPDPHHRAGLFCCPADAFPP